MKQISNLYNFLKENSEKLKINEELVEFFKNNIRYTSKHKFCELDRKYPNFRNIYEDFLKSEKFKKIINIIKNKHDEEYLKLFFRHSKNFLNLYIKDSPYYKIGRRLGVKSTTANKDVNDNNDKVVDNKNHIKNSNLLPNNNDISINKNVDNNAHTEIPRAIEKEEN